MFGRRKTNGEEPNGRGKTGQAFPTRLESADRVLCFEARFTYGWESVTAPDTLLMHGDAVARSLLRDVAAATAKQYRPILPADAEAVGQPRAVRSDLL